MIEPLFLRGNVFFLHDAKCYVDSPSAASSILYITYSMSSSTGTEQLEFPPAPEYSISLEPRDILLLSVRMCLLVPMFRQGQ